MPMPVSLLTRSLPITTDQTHSVVCLLETLDTSANVNVLHVGYVIRTYCNPVFVFYPPLSCVSVLVINTYARLKGYSTLHSSHGEPLNAENVNEEIDQHINQCFVGWRYFENAFLKVTPILKRYYIKSGIKSISIPLPIHIERQASTSINLKKMTGCFTHRSHFSSFWAVGLNQLELCLHLT
ncbi:hypothetical protein OUZ56_009831 [Daphnia magna]|uniref:Uncharacterized protein n=1 Tax=Daphnia magna TaxID=35525 RepID=A0ABR0AH06_9CRUS|nr:hypothetical protein OUZ56_009831 [Daphnia magna]